MENDVYVEKNKLTILSDNSYVIDTYDLRDQQKQNFQIGDESNKIVLKDVYPLRFANHALKFIGASEFSYNEHNECANVWACAIDESVTYSFVLTISSDFDNIATLIWCENNANVFESIPGTTYYSKARDLAETEITEANKPSQPQPLAESEKNELECLEIADTNSLGSKNDMVESKSTEETQQEQIFGQTEDDDGSKFRSSQEYLIINAKRNKCKDLLDKQTSALESTIWLGCQDG
ncbi:hypothetical protein RF11_14519 [Thelohanellus kitauei]|uniref:Uncharacterized protein n=1 Tax=Thelohanellus kitauei TaxID=669202 RepID=A0A0C2N1T6_THEKT|nr:hypothetical protein RF11_14519 [Thelohanellus kitauei]